MQEFIFEIPGEPVAKGRPRFTYQGKYPRAYTPKKTENYENLVKLSFMQQVGMTIPMIEGPIVADIIAYFRPPQSVSKKKLDEMVSNIVLPQKKPDCDNIAKIILDSLNGIAYQDDKQIVSLSIKKRYALTPYVWVSIRSLD